MPVRTISASLKVQWDGANYTDESDNLISAWGNVRQTSRSAGFLGIGLGQVGKANIELHNKNGRYSPDNVDSPLSGSIARGKFRNRQVELSAGVDGNACVLFTGFIRNMEEDAESNTVVFVCEDRGALLSDLKMSTSLMRDVTTGCYVEAILQDAGLSSSEYNVDRGYTRLPFAWMDDEPVWQELGLVAETEGGRVYVDRFGVVHFEDSARMLLSASEL